MARVGIIMGSDSDLPRMKRAGAVLEELEISYEVTISSAHRTPEKTMQWAMEAPMRGVEVIIAAAGGSAALPGVVAAHTPLPVIGVPLKAWALDGLDALLAIAQMPKGIPVATVAINGAENAALLAARILAVSDGSVRERVEKHMADQALAVEAKDAQLQTRGLMESDPE